jgi:hypothetical protein
MSRVLSLSLTDALYDDVSEHAKSMGLTVYQYVRRAVEMQVLSDDHILEMLSQYDDESGD